MENTLVNYPVLQQKTEEKQQFMKLKFPNILLDSFTSLIVGKPGSGKSYLVQELLTNEDLYYQKFHKIYFITPSPYEFFEFRENENWSKNLNVHWIFQKLKECEEIIVNSKKNQTFNILFVFDDVISEINKNQNEQFLLQLFLNRRHLIKGANICHLIVTQKYNLCPLKIRTQLDAAFIFQVNQEEWNSIKKEIIMQNQKETKMYLNQIFKEKYSFIYINLHNSTIYNKFKKINFISDLLN